VLLQIGSRNIALQVIKLHKQDSGANVISKDWPDSGEYSSTDRHWPTF